MITALIPGWICAPRDASPLADINRFWAKLGLTSAEEWTRVTYDVRIVHRVPEMVEFERTLDSVLPQFAQLKRIDLR